MKAIIIRYGEIALKGKNRANFENRLRTNIKCLVAGSMKKVSGRFILYAENPENAAKKLRKAFGVTSISIAEQVEADLEKIKEECLQQAEENKFSTFRITVQRPVKKIMPSPEIEKELGAFIVERTEKKVKLKKPDLEIFVELADKAYVFTEKIPCVGGLPSGIEGKAGLLLEGRNSVLAGLLAMKRGCEIIPLAMGDADSELLEEYGCRTKPIAVKNMQDAEKTAEKNACRALIVGQQLEDAKSLNTRIPVLRPLVGILPEKAEEMLLIK